MTGFPVTGTRTGTVGIRRQWWTGVTVAFCKRNKKKLKKCNLFNVNNRRECLRNLPNQRFMIKCLTIIQIELEFGNVGFYEGRKTGVHGKNPSEQRREPTTNSTHDAETRNRTRAKLVRGLGGEANAQPLRHHLLPIKRTLNLSRAVVLITIV